MTKERTIIYINEVVYYCDDIDFSTYDVVKMEKVLGDVCKPCEIPNGSYWTTSHNSFEEAISCILACDLGLEELLTDEDFFDAVVAFTGSEEKVLDVLESRGIEVILIQHDPCEGDSDDDEELF